LCMEEGGDKGGRRGGGYNTEVLHTPCALIKYSIPATPHKSPPLLPSLHFKCPASHLHPHSHSSHSPLSSALLFLINPTPIANLLFFCCAPHPLSPLFIYVFLFTGHHGPAGHPLLRIPLLRIPPAYPLASLHQLPLLRTTSSQLD